jgi:hypothetical protein
LESTILALPIPMLERMRESIHRVFLPKLWY